MGRWLRRRRKSANLRDVILFMAGLAGIAHETLVQHGERPTLLLLFAAMVGAPVVLAGDEGARRDRDVRRERDREGPRDEEEDDDA